MYAIHFSVILQNHHKCLAGIRVDHITVGLEHSPAEGYVLVEFDGTKRRTGNKPVGLEKATEWNELIPL